MNDLEKSTGVSNPLVLIQAAIDKGTPIEQLEKLFALQERWEKNRAAEAWADAVKKFQSLMPEVVKANEVRGKPDSSGNTKLLYNFADYADIMKIAQPILNDCGITVTFSTKLANGLMETICHVRVGIHVEDTSVTLGLPAIPNANDAQRAGGALQYGQRYALKAALNIRIKGEDNDAQGQDKYAPPENIGDEELTQIKSLIEDCDYVGNKVDPKAFCLYLGSLEPKAVVDEDLRNLPKSKFKPAMDALTAKKNFKKGAK